MKADALPTEPPRHLQGGPWRSKRLSSELPQQPVPLSLSLSLHPPVGLPPSARVFLPRTLGTVKCTLSEWHVEGEGGRQQRPHGAWGLVPCSRCTNAQQAVAARVPGCGSCGDRADGSTKLPPQCVDEAVSDGVLLTVRPPLRLTGHSRGGKSRASEEEEEGGGVPTRELWDEAERPAGCVERSRYERSLDKKAQVMGGLGSPEKEFGVDS